MNFINSLNDKHFTLNGVEYFRNYVSAVHGNKVEIYNCYERKDVLVPLTHFSEFTVDGSVYVSAVQLQAALLEVSYSRLTIGDSSSIDQNNIGRVINVNNIGPAENVFFNAASAVADKLNNMQVVITAKQTPVIVTASLLVSAGTYNYVSKRYKYLFKQGKGNWGLNGTPISWLQLELLTVENYLVDHLLSEPNAIINNLGEVPDGNFLAAANASSWDFSDSGLDGESGIKTYYFSYETDGVLYFVQFVGIPGIYGTGYISQFTGADFVSTTDSRITDVPTLEDVLAQGGNTNVSQFVNNGDGTSPYATVNSVNGLSLIVNQAASELYLKNNTGITLATINLGFLNNEGTTFFYNQTTEKLELKNDAGVILSEIPVSAFVSNLMESVEFNAVSPQLLEFKDAEGNVVDSVTVTINNIQGLQAILDTKADANGSNAGGTWPINITGTAGSSDTTSNWLPTFVTDFNTISGFKLLEANIYATNRPGNGAWGQGIQFSTNNNPSFINQLVFDVTGSLFVRSKYEGSWGLWSGIPFDENVLHNTGDEIKSGNLTINGNNKGYYLGNAGNNASIIYNSNGNLDIAPRPGYDTVFTAGKIGVGKIPEHKLDIGGSMKADGPLLINTSTNPGNASLKVNGAIEFDGNNFNLTSFKVNDILIGSLGQGNYAMTGGNPSAFGISSNGDLQFGAGYQPKAILKATGNMGIGTINPLHKFVVSREGNEGFEVAIPGNPDGRIYLQNYDRAASAFRPMHFSASSFIYDNELTIPAGITSTSAVNKSQLDSVTSSLLATITDNYIPKSGQTTKAGIMTFTDSPIIPDATAENHPITRKQLNTAQFVDFVHIKGINYTVNTINDIGQTGVITIYINAISNDVTISLPGVLNIADGYTYNFKRIDNSSYAAKIVSPMTIDGQTSISLGYLHAITIKSVIDKYWVFSKYTP